MRFGRLTGYGYLGVNFFFGISGFLITTRLINERTLKGGIDLRAFYLRRAFRILPPPFLFLATVSVLAALGVIAVNAQEVVASLLFYRNYLSLSMGQWYTGHFWSLAIEEHFYFLWPALLILFGVSGGKRWVPFLALAIAIWRAVDSHFQIFTGLFPQLSPSGRTDTNLDGLLWGCWLALLFRNETVRSWLESKFVQFGWWACVLAFVSVYLFSFPSAQTLGAVLIPLIIVVPIVHPTWLVSRFLELAPLRWIGRLSYGIYVWQQLFFVNRSLTPGSIQKFPLNVIFLLSIATVSYYVLEKPLIKVGRRLSTSGTRFGGVAAQPAQAELHP